MHRHDCGEAYRQADVISLSIEDRFYNYAVKLAAVTFKRSTSYIRKRYIVSVNSNFPVPKGHDANFAWNQYETAVKFVRE